MRSKLAFAGSIVYLADRELCDSPPGAGVIGGHSCAPVAAHPAARDCHAFGLDVALRFAECFGGHYLWLLAEARHDHPITRQLGELVLAWLIANHGRLDRIIVPKGLRDRISTTLTGMTSTGQFPRAIGGVRNR
jgi:hypothetical protein